MKKRYFIGLAVLAAVAGCAKYAIVPPAVDLSALGTLGLVTFGSENAKGDLSPMAAQYFLQEVTAAQRVPVVELGPLDVVLADVGKRTLDRETVRAIGEKYEIGAFFAGDVQVTKVKPHIDLLAPLNKTLFARATFDIKVTARLISAANGATLWTDSIVRQGTVGAVRMEDGVPVFAVRDKSTAMDNLLRQIMFRLTWDFRPTRQRL